MTKSNGVGRGWAKGLTAATDNRMAKRSWSKGLTAATDARIARAAAGHRGKVYTRRTPFEQCRWPVAGQTTLPIEWSDLMAYIVGLTATDGCLFTGRRKLNFKSEDRELVQTYLAVLGRHNRVKEQITRTGNIVYFTEFSDSRLYEWFRSVGLTPRKSLTIGALEVPDQHLAHFLRGHLDGDGSVLDYSYAGTGKARGHFYRTLNVRFISGSERHVIWLRDRISSVFGITGSLGWGGVHYVSFAKRAALRLLPLLYPTSDVPCLARKRAKWGRFVAEVVGRDTAR